MSTKREQILERLQEALGSMTGITASYRNRAELPDDKLPAVVVLDGGEYIVEQDMPRHKFGKMPPALFTLSPQVFIILRPRDDMTNETLDGSDAPIGPELSEYLDRAISAVVNDSVLLSLVGSNGQITYRGHDTDMATGRSIVGQIQIQFEFNYVFIPPQG